MRVKINFLLTEIVHCFHLNFLLELSAYLSESRFLRICTGAILKMIFVLILLYAIICVDSKLLAQDSNELNRPNRSKDSIVVSSDSSLPSEINSSKTESEILQTIDTNKSVEHLENLTELIIQQSDRQFDFKSIPLGMFSDHKFILTNPFQDELHISGVSSSCACTSVFLPDGKDTIQTYDKAAVVARLRSVDNTVGQKNATITVFIDKPLTAEIQLNTYGQIRPDISFKPTELRFETINSGMDKTRNLTVNYQGRNKGWRIVDIKSSNNNIVPVIESTQIYMNQTIVNIKTTVKSGMPDGEFTERIELITNETKSQRELPIVVSGRVGITISVAPEIVFFGYLKSGETSPVKSVLLKGTKPFKIKNFSCGDPAVQLVTEINTNSPAKQIHVLSLRYNNPENGESKPINEKIEATVKIETDLNDLTPTFKTLVVNL
ncbi:MAG: DUF1573 domain-containing protein [Planctomycetaceae bacterium]|jgi:hypothetical protein|nr:DUF1573 domain-containing protein [Planctomycetaceae bacterium]